MNKYKNLLPKIRFSIYNDNWQVTKMKEIFPVIRSGNRLPKDNIKKGDIPYIIATVSNNGIYTSIDKNTSDYHGNKMKLFPTPSITFSIDNPEAIFLQKNDFFTSNIMRVLNNRTLKEESYSFFLELLRKKTDGFDWSIKFSGPVVLNLEIIIPNSDEEINRIGKFFKTVDKLINRQQQKIDKLKVLKSAYLVDMFPKEGEEYPKRRFAGFEEPWKKIKLNEVTKYVTSSLSATDACEVGLYELYDANGVIGYVNKDIMEKDYLSIIKDGSGSGRVRYLPSKTAFTGTMGGITNNEKSDMYFLYILLEKFDFTEFITGATIPHVYYRDYGKSLSYFPTKKEQRKIGNFFQKLDNQIKVNEDKLEKLKQLKQAYLNDMFV